MEIVVPPTDRTAHAERIKQFILGCQPGRSLKVTVAETSNERSDPQNRALWSVAYPPLMDYMGLRGAREKQDLHEFWCGEYFGWDSYEIMGQRKKRPKRTTTTGEDGKKSKMSTKDFMDFFSFIQQRSAEYGVYIPDPDPEWFRKDERMQQYQSYAK